ncbi:MAG: hypothetical protein J6U86_05140 [Clostridia bacterium]|nr:hypothetical protein [Clostridia bacterium]
MENIIINKKHTNDKILSPEGHELLLYSIDIPQFEGFKRFNEFYLKIFDKTVAFCSKELYKKCDTQSTYSYRLSQKCHVENNRITVTLRATLTNRTARKSISEHIEKHIWGINTSRIKVIKK